VTGEALKVVNLKKTFGNVIALDRVSFSVERGSYVVILGPSGCGKTTLLRTIAGLYEPDEGEIYIDGRLVNGVPPHKRGVSLMFQSYALFPHMTVLDNIMYGLKVKKVPKDIALKKVKEIARMLNIEALLDRYPHQLSAGQQQRVALARALVVEPKVLLLDEPLSNLDAKIRAKVRLELRKLQRDLNITVLHVTHDQEEALAVADKIVVMNQGRIEQIGTPIEIYHNPKTKFVADFVGTMNFIVGVVDAVEGEYVSIRVGDIEMRALNPGNFNLYEKVLLAIRPENVEILLDKSTISENVFRALIRDSIFLGPFTRYIVSLKDANTDVLADVYGVYKNLNGREVYIHIPSDRILLIKE